MRHLSRGRSVGAAAAGAADWFHRSCTTPDAERASSFQHPVVLVLDELGSSSEGTVNNLEQVEGLVARRSTDALGGDGGELTTMERAQRALAQRTSRRGFLGRVGRGVVALAGGSLVATALAPDRAEAHHICGHTFTTGSCPHPFAPRSRTDRFGFPVHPTLGYPVDDRGKLYRDRATQTRSRTCQEKVRDVYSFVNDSRTRRLDALLLWAAASHPDAATVEDPINGDHGCAATVPRLQGLCISYRELTKSC